MDYSQPALLFSLLEFILVSLVLRDQANWTAAHQKYADPSPN